MRKGFASFTVRMNLEDAAEVRGLLEKAGRLWGNPDESSSELEGGALSVTMRLPLKRIFGFWETGNAKAEKEEDGAGGESHAESE